MPEIPLGQNAYRRLASFQPEVEMVNLFLEQDQSGAAGGVMRIMRPGLTRRADIAASGSRGVFRQDGVFASALFSVMGGSLFRDGVRLGSVPGTELVAFAATTDGLYILGGKTLLVYDGDDLSAVAIPDVDDAPMIPVDIDSLAGYLIISCQDGTFFWLVPAAGTIDPLDFATAESSSDGLVAGRRLGSEIFLFGASSVEPWQVTADPDAPFQKAVGRQFERGCLDRDSVQRFDNSILWVGDDLNLYRAGATPEILADEGLSERIRLRSDATSAWVLNLDRHKFYILRIPGQGSFAYDAATKTLSRFKSPDLAEWRAIVGLSDRWGAVAGDAATGTLWGIDPTVATEDDVAMEWAVSGSIPASGKPVRNDGFAVDVGVEEDCTIRFRWKDGRDDFPSYYEPLEARAPVDTLTIYRLGSVEPPCRTFELSGVDPVRVRISAAKTEAWQ